jgi:hypothetical protein
MRPAEAAAATSVRAVGTAARPRQASVPAPAAWLVGPAGLAGVVVGEQPARASTTANSHATRVHIGLR